MLDAINERGRWVERAGRLGRPVLEALAAGRLRAVMPVEQKVGAEGRREVTHLEAFGRLLAGLSPWLGSEAEDAGRVELAGLAQKAMAAAVDPGSPDCLNFSEGSQPLVDAAFLAQGILRSPKLLWEGLDDLTKRRLVAAMVSTRRIQPGASNWLLFSAMVEAFLALAGEGWDALRVDYALSQHMQWYKGDGAYGDGQWFHWDYYNSFVIQPMLLEVVGELGKYRPRWQRFEPAIAARAQRYAVIQERMIAPDGSFPAMGRSLAYRCGAFHLLAQLAWRKRLPAELSPGRVRGALGAVMGRTLNAAGTFDEAGWLRIGLCGHQPGMGEDYISTGSLYLCSMAFLPLGLGAGEDFWAAPAEKFRGERVWSGEDVGTDHAIADG